MRACEMCLPYTIIIFHPASRHTVTDNFPPTGTPASLYNSLTMFLGTPYLFRLHSMNNRELSPDMPCHVPQSIPVNQTAMHLSIKQPCTCQSHSHAPVNQTAMHLSIKQPCTCQSNSHAPVNQTAMHLSITQPCTCQSNSHAPVNHTAMHLSIKPRRPVMRESNVSMLT